MIVCNSFSITLFHEGVKELPNEPKQKEGKGDESNKSEVEGTPTKENKSVFSNSPSIASISSLSKKHLCAFSFYHFSGKYAMTILNISS